MKLRVARSAVRDLDAIWARRGLHSPNEKYCLDNYYKGIMTVAHFFEQYGAAAEPAPPSSPQSEVSPAAN
jgi:hypothetical protein